ncbi:MAG: exodeoxyribonuclease V subunit gamma, partial [Pseudomonadales bacterium]|nr:exodeoxyribonuclease V subunit gamma [Pseudomonadales bacterium]
MGFDLMVEHSRKWDRSRRDDDRYLFLEAMLSARSQLYISYVGRSIADNSHRAPSVLISELFEYAQQAYFLADSAEMSVNGIAVESMEPLLQVELQSRQLMQHLSTEHPLSAYHSSYFDQSAGLFSYARQWLPIAELEAESLQQNSFLQALPQSPLEQLELSALIDFYRQPIRYFFVHKLQVNFVDEEAVIDDEEPFSLSGLDNYITRDQLLRHALSDKDTQSYSQFISQSGLMPLGVAGDKNLAKNLHDGVELAEKIKPLLSGKLRRLAFDLSLQNLQLQGWIEPLYDIGVVKFSAANSSGRSYISTWIAHLAACANGCSHPTYFRAINEQFHFRPLPQQSAVDYLNTLIAIYRQGLVQPLAWLPVLGWPLFKGEDQGKTRQNLEKNYNLFNDPYIHRVFPKWQDIASGLSLLNNDILAPLSEYLVIDTEEAID